MTDSQVIVLYGQEHDLVEDLKEFIGNLGLTVYTITEMGSGGKVKIDKVKEHISACRLAIVLATFDSKTKTSKQPRPNVIHELTLCLEYKADATVVLTENRGGKPVDLGSNIKGHYVELPDRKSVV